MYIQLFSKKFVLDDMIYRIATDLRFRKTSNLKNFHPNFGIFVIGTLSLDLAKLHRPARSDKKCSLAILSKHAPRINLFKIRRTKGWWPFKNFDSITREEICAVSIRLLFWKFLIIVFISWAGKNRNWARNFDRRRSQRRTSWIREKRSSYASTTKVSSVPVLISPKKL